MIEDIINYIAQHIEGYTPAENLFANYYPDEPDNIISVIYLGGTQPQKYTPLRELTFEIKYRNENFNDGMATGNQIMDLFHSKENYSIGNSIILHSYAVTEISYLYTDKNNRDEFSIEFAFIIQN